MASRRMMLIAGGAGVVILGAAALRLHSDLGPARAPWRDAGKGFGDNRLDALSYAVLAPSPHNLQPWLVRLEDEDGLTLFCDLDRRLPATDPQDRQVVIALGAFVELLRQAAAEAGCGLEVEPFPQGEPYPVLDERPAASVRFIEGAAKDPLFAQILNRRTSRTPFDQARAVAPETMAALEGAMRPGDGDFQWTNDREKLEALKKICRGAWRIEMETPGPRHESAIYTRVGERAINAAPDGISLYGPVMEAAGALGVITGDKMDDPGSAAYDETIKFYNRNINTAMAFGWLTTAGNSRTEQLRAGAAWVRVQQAAAGAGLSMQPFSQALQEYPEMAAVFEEMRAFAGAEAPACVQGLFRFGYGAKEPPAPRWPMETRLIEV